MLSRSRSYISLISLAQLIVLKGTSVAVIRMQKIGSKCISAQLKDVLMLQAVQALSIKQMLISPARLQGQALDSLNLSRARLACFSIRYLLGCLACIYAAIFLGLFQVTNMLYKQTTRIQLATANLKSKELRVIGNVNIAMLVLRLAQDFLLALAYRNTASVSKQRCALLAALITRQALVTQKLILGLGIANIERQS